MSHESDYPQIVINPEWKWDWYYFIPYLDRNEWDGIEYQEVRYSWDELDYRFGVDYNGPAVPEPADAGFITSIALAIFVVFCHFKNKKDIGKK